MNCSCRNQTCPIDNKCNAKDVIYKASLPDNKNDKNFQYIGMTSEEIRKRVSKHKQSFNNAKYKGETTLSKKFWELKETQCPSVEFKIIKLSKSYTAGDTICLLCTDEKMEILKFMNPCLLNNRREIFNLCRHRARIKISKII